MPTCRKCHASFDEETVLCPLCGTANADANPARPEGQAMLAASFLFGARGVRPDGARARLWAEKAAKGGDPDGAIILAKCILQDAMDEYGSQAPELLEGGELAGLQSLVAAAAERFDERKPALFEPTVLLATAAAIFLVDAPERSFRYFLRAAELGNVPCMRQTGILLGTGRGTERNVKRALEWLSRAAEGGSPEALGDIGRILTEPGPSAPDFNLGVRYLERASEKRDLKAKGVLGLLLRFGDGVRKDLKRAINLMSEAAENGDPMLQRCLGVLLWNGEDNVKPNLPVARKWMAKAAARDFGDAKALLAKIDDAIALEELGITQEELDAPNEPPPAEEPAVPLAEADALRRENEALHAEVRRLHGLSEKYRSQLLAFTGRMEAERKGKLAALAETKDSLFQAARGSRSDPTAYVNLAKYFESAFGDDIAFTDRAWRSLEECTSDLHLVWTALYHLATTLHKLLKTVPQAEAYERFRAKAGNGLEIARGNGKMTHANSALMANYRDTYAGRTIDVEAHVEKGGDSKSPRFLRLYFGYDPSVADKIVVSHVGSHLPTFQTLTKVGGW